MKFCSKCGVQLGDEIQFCHNCGSKVEAPAETSAPVENVVYNSPIYGQQPPQNQYYVPAEPIAQHSMKWYKFLIYFSLFLGAIINLINGLIYMTGGIYYVLSNGESSADIVYGFYGGGLKALDVTYGILLIAFAGFGIYTRSRLAKYKSNGPKCICILFVAGAVLTLLYNIALIAVTGLDFGEMINGEDCGSIGASIGMAVYNYYYFKKRKDLFVNP
ncbi:MAG: zinc-ribbon domain-containing protein [Acutalibacteraceae bacterium]